MIRTLLICLLLTACGGGGGESAPVSSTPEVEPIEPRNILMIAVDDLNKYVGFMGGYPGESQTPHIDNLADEGLAYINAHAVSPACMPSRAAVMFGKLPSTTGIDSHSGFLSGGDDFGEYHKLLKTDSLPLILSRNGYKTISMGKIFHDMEPEHWDVQGVYEVENIDFTTDDGFDYSVIEGKHPDQVTAEWAVEQLIRDHDKPFFMAIGFSQPHQPWNLPQWAYDLHSQVILPDYEDMTGYSEEEQEMARRPYINGVPNYDAVMEAGTHEDIMRAYLAAMSHTDAMVGMILEAVPDNTVIILWSDHGYHLGEKQHFRKSTLFDQSTRVPLIIKAGQSGVIDSPVSLIDVAPTILDIAGVSHAMDGVSLLGGSSPVTVYWDGLLFNPE